MDRPVKKLRLKLMCLLAAGLPALAPAQDSNPLGMSYVQTSDLQLIYFESLGYLVPHSVRTFTNAIAWQRRMLGWVPSQRTGVLLKDFADYGNASAWAAPRNTVFVDVAPPSLAFETGSTAERMYSLMNHELVHVATNDHAAAQDRFWRGLFAGKVAPHSANPESLLYGYLTLPRFHAPRWYLEGSAVFLETWMGGGIGRAQGGYDEMVFRAMVRDDARFYDALGLVSRGVMVDFQVGVNAYLYGTRFFTWLAYAHMPQKVLRWLRRDEDSQRHYAAQFEHVFGLPLAQAWQDWINFERGFQRANLERVRAQPITPYRALKGSAMGSISRTYLDAASGTLYGAFRSAGVLEHVGALNIHDGSTKRLVDIKRGMLYRVSALAFDAAGGTLFFTNDNHAMRDLMALDLKSGQQRLLMENARIGEIVFNPADRSLMGVRHHNGIASLVRIPHPYTEWQLVHEFPYGVVPSDLDISADGTRLAASVSEVNADQFVRVWELAALQAGQLKPLSEFRFGQSVPESFVFSRDGRYLYGSSYYTGVSNIFRYEVATGAVEAVSNADVGFFRPLEMTDAQGKTTLLVQAYTGAGFVPAVIAAQPLKDVSAIKFLGSELIAKHPELASWQVPPANTVDADAQITERGIYHPLYQLRLANAYPVLQGYKSAAGLGLRVNFEDPIRFASVSVTAAVTPSTGDLPGSQRGHLDVSARYLGWRAGLSWNKSDFYDLFGPTKRSRKGLALRLGYDHFIIYVDPRKLELVSDLAHFTQIDTLPDAQNVGSGFTRLSTAQVKLNFTDLRRSLGAVDDESGVTWTLGLSLSRAGTQTSALLRGGVDVGMALPWAHASLWSRTAAGLTEGQRSDAMAGFYFGGFGNNVVDNGPVKRYREAESLPGFAINRVSARRYARQMVELTLPPWVFESAGVPGFHATWLRPGLFATTLWTQGTPAMAGPASLRRYASLGGQLDLRLATLHWYEMMLSAGFATGYEGSRRSGQQWMLSLKVM